MDREQERGDKVWRDDNLGCNLAVEHPKVRKSSGVSRSSETAAPYRNALAKSFARPDIRTASLTPSNSLFQQIPPVA
jgi:hypothetical protein